MEIRGLGIIDIKTLYGLGAVRLKRLDLIVELIENENAMYMSTPTEMIYSNEILDTPIRKKQLCYFFRKKCCCHGWDNGYGSYVQDVWTKN